MKLFILNLIILIFFSSCLKTKRSGFDSSSPIGILLNLGFSGFFSNSASYSISGTISGFNSGTLVLTLNTSNTLSLTGPQTSFAFTQKVASGSSYVVDIKQHPSGQVCTLSNASGNIKADVTNVSISCAAATIGAYYSFGTDWMDYIKRDTSTTNSLSAVGTACTGSETGWYNSCIHAGEIRSITIPNLTSCTGITANDNLGVFNWTCTVTNSVVKVVSTGLQYNKHLSDLINFTSASWKSNYITVSLNGATFLTTSPSSSWWSNPIQINNGGGTLSTSKTIYITNLTNTVTGTYVLNSQKIALVIQPGYEINTPTTTLVSLRANFLWLEGNLKLTAGSGNAIDMTTSPAKFSVIRNVTIDSNSSAPAITNSSSSANYFYMIRGRTTTSNFINMNYNTNIYNQITAYNSAANVLYLSSTQPDNILISLVLFNSAGDGVNIANSGTNNNIFLNLTGGNHSMRATAVFAGATNNSFMNVVSANNGNSNYGMLDNGTNSQYINVALAHYGANSFFSTGGTNLTFHGTIKISNSGAGCSITGTNPGIISSSCAMQSPSTASTNDTTINMTNSFVGKLSSDTSNSQSTGMPNPQYSQITDWVNFANYYRGWGMQGSTFPSSTQMGQGTGTTSMAIWDWSLKSTDAVIRNVNSCPSGSVTNTHTWSNSSTVTFLRNAVEIFGDGIGNDNGICESNEDCLYTPNIGAYQGHGNLVSASSSSSSTNTCYDIGTVGTISNVKLWKWDTNGY